MINPVQAVTAVLPQHPAPSPPEHLVPIPHPRAVNSYTRTVALSVTAGALLTAALVAIGAVVIPQGRRRHWRPGRLTPAPAGTLPHGQPATPPDQPTSTQPPEATAPPEPVPATPPRPPGARHRRRRK